MVGWYASALALVLKLESNLFIVWCFIGNVFLEKQSLVTAKDTFPKGVVAQRAEDQHGPIAAAGEGWVKCSELDKGTLGPSWVFERATLQEFLFGIDDIRYSLWGWKRAAHTPKLDCISSNGFVLLEVLVPVDRPLVLCKTEVGGLQPIEPYANSALGLPAFRVNVD